MYLLLLRQAPSVLFQSVYSFVLAITPSCMKQEVQQEANLSGPFLNTYLAVSVQGGLLMPLYTWELSKAISPTYLFSQPLPSQPILFVYCLSCLLFLTLACYGL